MPPDDISDLKRAIDELERRVARMEEALYGNGQIEGIIYRIAKMETEIESLRQKIEDMKASIDDKIVSLRRSMNTNTMLTVGTFLTIIVTLISMLVGGQ